MSIEMRGIRFSYGAVQALDGVDFDVAPGEAVALLGDNGAGKSTLIKVLAGVLRADEGTVEVDGKPLAVGNPVAARQAGIETLYQDLALFDNLDVTMNFFIGRERSDTFGFLRFHDMWNWVDDLMGSLGIRDVPPRRLVQELSGGQRQITAIARAIGFGSKYLVLDEPTSALSPTAAEELLAMTRSVVEGGLGVVVITHNVGHALQVADRVVVMRLGRVAGTLEASETDPSEVVSVMQGSNSGAPQTR